MRGFLDRLRGFYAPPARAPRGIALRPPYARRGRVSDALRETRGAVRGETFAAVTRERA